RELDDRDAHAERFVHGRHLESDDAAADDEHPLWQLLELERTGRIHDARIVRHVRQPYRLGARGDDALVEVDGLDLAVAHDLDAVRADEPAGAVHDADLALLRDAREPAGQLADDGVLPVAELAGIDARLAEVDAARGHLLRLLDHARGVQQRLRRDAPDVETHAAERRPTLDQRDVEPEIGGTESRRVTARAGAEHGEPRAGASPGRGDRGGRRRSGRLGHGGRGGRAARLGRVYRGRIDGFLLR